jgi:HlyD family secretion protein
VRRDRQGDGDRSGRMVERLKTELQLTDVQEAAVKQALAKLGQEAREGGQGPFTTTDRDGARQRLSMRIDQALAPLLTDAQKPAYEKWKQGRETTHTATLWVLGAGGGPERRQVRTGLTDDQFTEIISGLDEGESVVVRAREAKS